MATNSIGRQGKHRAISPDHKTQKRQVDQLHRWNYNARHQSFIFNV
ncbi:hypothetical protein [Nostoc sp. C052]|nr:hypothetical protein [Nostoc sp. C052]